MKKLLFNKAITAFVATLILLAITFILPCLPAQADESSPEVWGLFVGVSYKLSAPEVKYADDDARALYETLSPIWGAANTKLLVDSEADEQEILDGVAWLAQNADADDTVVFTFSGLGTGVGAICPADFNPLEGGLTTDQLAKAFEPVKAGKILIILDCNYAAKFRVSLTKEGRFLMFSSPMYGGARESDEIQHGYLSYFVLQALNSPDVYDVNENYELSAEEIASYATEMTANTTSNLPPVIVDLNSDEFPLLTYFTYTSSLELPAEATILTLDGVDYNAPPEMQIWAPGSTHTMTVPDVIDVGTGTRYLFVRWDDDSVSTARIISKGSYSAGYRLEYLFDISSAYGVVTSAGWYSRNTTVDFSVTPFLETAYAKFYFEGWSGDYTGTLSTGSILMDGPKTVTAVWRTVYLLVLESDYGNPNGAGWYNEGAPVNISIESVHGSLIRQIFIGWSGDFYSLDASTMVRMDSSKVIVANWMVDYLWLYVFILIITVVVGISVYLLVHYRVFRRLFPPPRQPRKVKIMPPSPPPSRRKR
ncbi:MAG: caspase family protein [Dehalococcoidales bacterium]|nr:caspase family protein [Dehalococcoidales bacterium]